MRLAFVAAVHPAAVNWPLAAQCPLSVAYILQKQNYEGKLSIMAKGKHVLNFFRIQPNSKSENPRNFSSHQPNLLL